MKVDKLIFKRAKHHMGVFTQGKEYIYLGEAEDFNDCGIFISDENSKEVCSNNKFELSSVKTPIKDVVCIYEGKRKTLTTFGVYSVFHYFKADKDSEDIYEDRFTVIDNNYNYAHYPCDYFMSLDEFESIKDREEFSDIISSKIKRIKEINNLDEELPLKKELINEILNLVSQKKLSNKTLLPSFDVGEVKSNVNKMRSLACASTLIVTAMCFVKSPISIIISVIVILASLAKYKAFMNKIFNELPKNEPKKELSDGIREYNNLEQINKLPLELLGKIKFIENNIMILGKINVAEDILKLIKESVDLTVLLVQYEHNDITNKKLNEFLDNTINYIHTLKTNKHIEENYIKEELAKNLNEVIDKNSSIFKSMVDDNKYIMEQFNTN